MAKKGLYPTEKAVKDMLISKGWIFPEDSALKLTAMQGAELGADYAIKKVIEYLDKRLDWADNPDVLEIGKYTWEALKKSLDMKE